MHEKQARYFRYLFANNKRGNIIYLIAFIKIMMDLQPNQYIDNFYLFIFIHFIDRGT